MQPDDWSLYEHMYRCRLYEEVIAGLWDDGLISGEMHLGTGEEGIVVAVVSQLRPGDAMALDHRGTAAMLVRGVDPGLILRELLGLPGGLCGGNGGHMHMFSREHLAATSGIVGAEGPTAAGFALAAQHLHPGAIAVAFFGEGAMNQGMLMEAMNLASVWQLPVLFVCKDDQWAITSDSSAMTGGNLSDRVAGLGVRYVEADGRDVGDVWQTASQAIERARSGRGPTFLHARCVHLEGHLLGFLLLRAIRSPLQELPAIGVPLVRSVLAGRGASLRKRVAGLRDVLLPLLATLRDARRDPDNDPVARALGALAPGDARLADLQQGVEGEVTRAVASALQELVA